MYKTNFSISVSGLLKPIITPEEIKTSPPIIITSFIMGLLFDFIPLFSLKHAFFYF